MNRDKDIDKIINAYSTLKDVDEIDMCRAKKRLFTRINEYQSRDMRLKKIFRVAVIILLPILSVFLTYYIVLYNSTSKQRNIIVNISAPEMGRIDYTLDDGTKVWINAGSTLGSYNNYSGVKKREVFMKEGECYFDVANNEKVPFVVNIEDIKILVKGTEFNCYNNGKEISVSLVSGRVDICDNNFKTLYKLKPNEQFNYNLENKSYNVITVDPEQYCAWKDGYIIFNNANIYYVADRLRKMYNIDVEISSEITELISITAKFSGEKIEDVLSVISFISNIKYRVETIDDSISKVIFY